MPKKVSTQTWIERFNQTHNTEEYIKEHGHEHYDYSLIIEIKRNSDKVPIRCIEHDFVFEMRTSDHFNGKQGCRVCAKSKMGVYNKLSNEEIDKRLIKRNIKRLENIINTHIHAKWKCVKKTETGEICEYIWMAPAGSIVPPNKIGSGCPKCSGHVPITNQEIDKRLKEQNRDHLIERKSNILSMLKSCQWKCKICDWTWDATPNSVVGKGRTGCPHCKLSKGALEVANFLKNREHEYSIELSFFDLINPLTGECLWFDFAVYDSNKKIKYLIEYQGEQHYIPMRYNPFDNKYVSFGKSQKELQTQQFRDQLKRDYCEKNNIKLIEIPYWEFQKGNLENYLLNILSS